MNLHFVKFLIVFTAILGWGQYAFPAASTDTMQFTKQAYFTEVDNGNSGAADTIDWTAGNKQKSTLTGSPGCTYTFTAPSGPCNLLLKVIQGAGGSKTVTWPVAVVWSDGVAPTLSTAESAVDVISFYYDGTSYYSQTFPMADSNLAQITTAAKVSGAAITLLTSVPSGAGLLPNANVNWASPSAIGTGTPLAVNSTALQVTTQAYFDAEVDNGNSGGSDTIDWTAGNKQLTTLTGSPGCTFTFTAPTGPCNLMLRIVQGAGGSKTATWPASCRWPSGIVPVLSTAAASVDIIAFYYDGTYYYAQVGYNFIAAL